MTTALLYVCAVVAAAQATPHIGPAEPLTSFATTIAAEADGPPLVLHPGTDAGRLSVAWGDHSLTRMPVEVRTTEGVLVRLDCVSPQQDLDLSDLPSGHYILYLMDLSGIRAQQRFTLPLNLASL